MNKSTRTVRLAAVMVLALAGGSQAQPSAATGAPDTSAAASFTGASAGIDLPATGIETSGNIIIDHRNGSITIKATPSKHREIEKLLELLTQDPLASKDVRVASFDLLNLSPDQFRELIRFHKPSLNPNDQRRFHIEQAPEHRGMQSIVPPIPQVSANTGAVSNAP